MTPAPKPTPETPFHIELIDTTRVLLDKIASPEFRQPDIALTYAMAIRSSDPTDWKKVNAAIVARWSISGLERIKTRAWKLVEGKWQLAKPVDPNMAHLWAMWSVEEAIQLEPDNEIVKELMRIRKRMGRKRG